MRTRRALGVVALAATALAPVVDASVALAPGHSGSEWRDAPRSADARRRWALSRMDEMANERLRCRERLPSRRQVEECEAEYLRRYRHYNEIYLDAPRE